MSALDKILAERKRQDEKWGEQNHPDEWWLPILVEEVGELSEAMLEARFGMGGMKNARQEAIEVAAVALAWVECHERFANLMDSAKRTLKILEEEDGKQQSP